MTTPVLYLQFQEVIDSFIGKVSEEKNKLLEVFKSKVVSKIPRATKVEGGLVHVRVYRNESQPIYNATN